MPECKFACSCVDKDCRLKHLIPFNQREKLNELLDKKIQLFYVRTCDNIVKIHLNKEAFVDSKISKKNKKKIVKFLDEKMN